MAPASLSIEERAAKAGPPPTWGADSHKTLEPPMEYFTSFPRHAPALFSTNNGMRPRRSLDHFHGPRSIFPWNASQIVAAAGTLRKYCFPLFKYIQKPTSYDDLYHYWDAYDLWHMGAYNLWNVLNYLYAETQLEMPALEAETRKCIEEWASTLLQTPACRSKLMAWDPDIDDNPLSVFDGEELVDLDGMENFWLSLVEDVLKSAQYDLLRNKYITPALTLQPNAPYQETGFDNSHGYYGKVWSFHTTPTGPVGPFVFGDSFNPSKTVQSSQKHTNSKSTKEICVVDGTSATAAKKALPATNTRALGVTFQPTGPSVTQPRSTSLDSIQETDETDKPQQTSLSPQNGHQNHLISSATSSRTSSAPTRSPLPDQHSSVPSKTGCQVVRLYPANQTPAEERLAVPALTAQTIQPAPGNQILQDEAPQAPDVHLALQPYGQQPNSSHYPRLEPTRWTQAPYLQLPVHFPMPGTVPAPIQQPQSYSAASNDTGALTKSFTPASLIPTGSRGNAHVDNSNRRVPSANFQKGRNQCGFPLPAPGSGWSGPHFPPHMQGQTSGSGPAFHTAPMDDRRVSALRTGDSGPPHVPMAIEPVYVHSPKGRNSSQHQTMHHGNATDSMHAPQHHNRNPALDKRGDSDCHDTNSRHESQVGNPPVHEAPSSQMAHQPRNRGRGDTASSLRSTPQDPSCLNWARWQSFARLGSQTYDPCPCRFCKAKDHSVYIAPFRRQEMETQGAQQSIWRAFSRHGSIENMRVDPRFERCTVTIRYRDQESVFSAVNDATLKHFDFCDHPIKASHPWGSQFYKPRLLNNHMPNQPDTLPHQLVRSISEQPGPQAGSPLAAHSTVAPGVSDVLDHMASDVNRHALSKLQEGHDQVASSLQSADLSSKDFDLPKRDTASGETRTSEKSDVLLTKIQELVSSRPSRAGSPSQNVHQAATGGVPSLTTQEHQSSGDDKIDHGTVIRRPKKGAHGALPMDWNQQAGSGANHDNSVTRNTSSYNLEMSGTTTPVSSQKSKKAENKGQKKNKTPTEQSETSALPTPTNDNHGLESMKRPSEDQKRAGRSTLNPMGFDLHGSPSRGSPAHTHNSSAFVGRHNALPSGSTDRRPEYDQQMRDSQQCQTGYQPGQQYGSLAVKKQRGVQGHEHQPNIVSSSSQKPSGSAPPGDFGPPLGYSTLGLPYPSPPKTSVTRGACKPSEEQPSSTKRDDMTDQNKPSNGFTHLHHRESSIPFPPYVEPPFVQPSAVVPLAPRRKPTKKQGGKKKMLNPMAKEFISPATVSSDRTATAAAPEAREVKTVPASQSNEGPTSRPVTPAAALKAREVEAVPASQSSEGPTSRPVTPALPRESTVLESASKLPTESVTPVKDDASEASSCTMTANDDAARERDCKPMEEPPAAEKAKDDILDEGKELQVSEEPVIKPTVESQPTPESSQPKDSEMPTQQPADKLIHGPGDTTPHPNHPVKPTQQPIDKPAVGPRDAAAGGGKKRETNHGKQWPKNKHFKKGHKRQEARGDINQSWRKGEQTANQGLIIQAPEATDRDTGYAPPAASGERDGGSNKEQGPGQLAAEATSKEQNHSSSEQGNSLHKESISTKATQDPAEKAAASVEHNPSTASEPKTKTQNQAQSATAQSDAPKQQGTTPGNIPADTEHSSGPEKRAWSVAVPLIAPAKPGNPVEPPKTKSRAASKAETPAVTTSNGNHRDEPNQKATGQEGSKKGNSSKKQKKTAANPKEEPSSTQAQPPRYVPGANWVEEPEDNRRSNKSKAAQSIDKNAPTPKNEGSLAKDKASAPAPSSPAPQPAPAKTELQANEKGQAATGKASDSTPSSAPVTATTNDTPSQKDHGELTTKTPGADTSGPSTTKTHAEELSNAPSSTTGMTKAQKKKQKWRTNARKKAQLDNPPTNKPAASQGVDPTPTGNTGASTAAPEKTSQPQAKPTDSAKSPGQSAPPPPPASASSSLKDGAEALAPASKETSPKKPGRASKKTKDKDDGGSHETLLEGEERKGG